ncbi:uncharacterized protein LOC121736426 [Aricia agestis]|uniref:uncharacterized protein LOC121736426 n=1 Tax=Aricia agestis TaxID=91739 RepID=UPI001C20A199|nr:uncharacterized protein LOC121736426 [Aricia agestis]
MSYNLVWLFIILKCIAQMKCHVEYVDDYQETTEGSDVQWALDPRSYMRCTRRFTPGHCVTPLRPVWTYDIRDRTCNERLGCRARSRFNRFDSRESCELRCRNLIVLMRTWASYINRAGNQTDDLTYIGSNRRRMYYAEKEKLKKYVQDEKEEDEERHIEDGPVESDDDDDDRYSTEADIDTPGDDYL